MGLLEDAQRAYEAQQRQLPPSTPVPPLSSYRPRSAAEARRDANDLANLLPLDSRPDIRRSLDYLNNNPDWQQFQETYQEALRNGEPLPSAPNIAPPPPSPFPTHSTLESAREARPVTVNLPPPYGRRFMRPATEAGASPSDVTVLPNYEDYRLRDYRESHPLWREFAEEYQAAQQEGRPLPSAPELPPMPDNYQPRQPLPQTNQDRIPPARPAPMPWQRPPGYSGRRVEPVNLLPPIENTLEDYYRATHPEYQRYFREYEESIRTGGPRPVAPDIPPMPSDFRPPPAPRPGAPHGPMPTSARPSSTPFPPPATIPAGTPRSPLPTGPPPPANYTPEAARPAPRQTDPRPFAEPPLSVAPAPNPHARPATPGRPRAPRTTTPRGPRIRVPGRIPLSRLPIPIPFSIPDIAPESPIWPNNPLPNLTPGLDIADQLIRYGGSRVANPQTPFDSLLSFAPGMGTAIAADALIRRLWPRRPEEGPRNTPPIALPPQPIVGAGDWTIRVESIFFAPRAHLSNTTTMRVWGPVWMKWNSDGLPGRDENNTVAAVYALHYGFPPTVNPSPSPTPIVFQVSGASVSGAQSVVDEVQGTFRYRAWRTGTSEPSTPMLPAPAWMPVNPELPVNPFSPYPPPRLDPSLRGPQLAPPGFPIPLIPAVRPVTLPGSPLATPRPGGSPSPGPNFSPSGRPARGPAPNRTPTPTPTRHISFDYTISTPTEDPTLSCRFRDDPFSPAIRNDTIAANQKLDRIIGLLGDAAILDKLNTMDQKLGPQLRGGIAGTLQKFARSSLLQGVLNAFNFITALHNAFMLSNNIKVTLFAAFDTIYQLPGMSQFAPIDPETDEPIPYGQWVSESLDTLFRQAFGDQTVDTVSRVYKKANRIYQATANILWSIQSITFSILESMEILAEWIAWIGNALKRFGAVHEKAYRWMNPQINFTNNRFFNALNNTQEAVEAIDEVSSEVLNITETSVQLTQQVESLQREITGEGTELPNNAEFPYASRPDAGNVQQAEVSADSDSQGAVITPESEQPPVTE